MCRGNHYTTKSCIFGSQYICSVKKELWWYPFHSFSVLYGTRHQNRFLLFLLCNYRVMGLIQTRKIIFISSLLEKCLFKIKKIIMVYIFQSLFLSKKMNNNFVFLNLFKCILMQKLHRVLNKELLLNSSVFLKSGFF